MKLSDLPVLKDGVVRAMRTPPLTISEQMECVRAQLREAETTCVYQTPEGARKHVDWLRAVLITLNNLQTLGPEACERLVYTK